MPAFADLSAEELAAVTRYVRETLSGGPDETEIVTEELAQEAIDDAEDGKLVYKNERPDPERVKASHRRRLNGVALMTLRRRIEHSEAAKQLGEAHARVRARQSTGLGDGPVSRAIASGQPDVAVELVAAGDPATDVDWAVLPMAVLHQVRQAAHRRRVPAELAPVPDDGAEVARARCADGIARIDGLVRGPALDELRADLDRFLRHIELRLQRGEGTRRGYHDIEHYWPDAGEFVTNDALAWSPALVALAAHPDLLALAGDHLGRRPVVQRAMAMRYLPQGPGVEDTQYRWHHDLEERRCKVMILLTDVAPDDQPMRYLPGSHEARHSLQRFRDNALGPRYRRRIAPAATEQRATGAAGDTSSSTRTARTRPQGPRPARSATSS